MSLGTQVFTSSHGSLAYRRGMLTLSQQRGSALPSSPQKKQDEAKEERLDTWNFCVVLYSSVPLR